ncbi:MAG TPA: MarR family transcriptional regulator [Nocardioidaceae bacterium]|nr:MarR family transcriptional regulator [Nocardioidaceae bacterium]
MSTDVAKLVRTRAGLASSLAVSVSRLSRRLRKERHSDLSPTQLSALGSLMRKGPLTLGALARSENVQPPSMTRTVNCLEDMGMVVRQPDPDDGRQVLLRVSEPGLELLNAERKRRDAWLAQRLIELEPQERAVLREAAVILERLATA